MGEITDLLNQAQSGNTAARDELFRRLHAELLRLASQKAANAGPLTLLDPPSLLNETYLRLVSQKELPGHNRVAFFAYASQVMRSVIISYVRARNAEKRGGEIVHVTLTASQVSAPLKTDELEALDSAMQALKQIDARAYDVVEMRYFGGLTIDEIAEALSVSPATVSRDWERARAVLFKLMNP